VGDAEPSRSRPHPDPLPGGEGEGAKAGCASATFDLVLRANERVGPNAYVAVLDVPAAPLAPTRFEPGQFLMLRTGAGPGGDGCDPLLRRPFAPVDVHPPSAGGGAGRVELLYSVYGRGTRALAGALPGLRFDAVGPLGRGFSPPPPPEAGPIVVVAGGVGLAPFHHLARELTAAGRRDIHVVVGARTREGLILADRFRALGVAWRPTTDAGDDPQAGRGTAVDELERLLGELPRPPAILYSCGPWPMMRATALAARARGLRCEVSLERRMACGFGVCFTCVERLLDPARGGYWNLRTCLDGPVVDAARLDLGPG